MGLAIVLMADGERDLSWRGNDLGEPKVAWFGQIAGRTQDRDVPGQADATGCGCVRLFSKSNPVFNMNKVVREEPLRRQLAASVRPFRASCHVSFSSCKCFQREPPVRNRQCVESDSLWLTCACPSDLLQTEFSSLLV